MLPKLFIALLTKSNTFLLGTILLDKPKLYVTEEFVEIEGFLAIGESVINGVFVRIVEFVGVGEF